MKEIVNIYKINKISIEKYIHSVVESLPVDYIGSAGKTLKQYHFIQLMYEVDQKYMQTTPTVCHRGKDTEGLGSDKSHYFRSLRLDDKGVYVSNPYIHYRTGKASISVVAADNDRYRVFDIDLLLLLEHLRMIEHNTLHEHYKKVVYSVGSIFLSIVSIMLIIYGGYVFIAIIFGSASTDFLQDIFKSIISITLGLAIFDLSKQIFEHEVLFQSFQQPEDKQYKVLGKFLISIVIALSIETLMVVFKITLDDYTQMLAAFYLIIGTTFMFIGLGYYYKILRGIEKNDRQ
ncbi:hypothetical protein ACM66Z_05260 [Sulfurovum sp. ST-21]|uniref:General glycosylation pathway protein n=1 Tax=Sulfurovum indicum TaxID=2779528 RepID=A0A7M1S678_9BACT|nr:hypothetical protein [Sulfurovum indicum]QOR62868.1 hypothetical protein IMZ28_05225 [Sulfurovum indicum]